MKQKVFNLEHFPRMFALSAGFAENVVIKPARCFFIHVFFWRLNIAIPKPVLKYKRAEKRIFTLLHVTVSQLAEDPQVQFCIDWSEPPILVDMQFFYWCFSIGIYKNKNEFY